jgi:hypothetical protein
LTPGSNGAFSDCLLEESNDMAEFSTGPWERTGSNIYAPAGEGDILVHYDVAHVNNIHDDEGKANARLIVEAPEMFSLLELIVDKGNPSDDVKHRIRSVLDKVTGKD